MDCRAAWAQRNRHPQGSPSAGLEPWPRTKSSPSSLRVGSGWCRSRPDHGLCNWESDPRGSALRCAIAGFSADATSHRGNGEKHRPQSSRPLHGSSPGCHGAARRCSADVCPRAESAARRSSGRDSRTARQWPALHRRDDLRPPRPPPSTDCAPLWSPMFCWPY